LARAYLLGNNGTREDWHPEINRAFMGIKLVFFGVIIIFTPNLSKTPLIV
jgi:hypothetical protein